MRALAAAACVLLVASAAPAVAADDTCPARGGRKGGVRFLALCAGDAFISAAPLACTKDELARAPCEPVTALEATPLAEGRGNGPVAARRADAAEAARLCAERLGGRLPTPAERAAARAHFGLVSLEVREEPGEFARLRLEEAPEWVAEAGPAIRTAGTPAPDGAVLLRCVAAPARVGAAAVPLGSVCDERPPEAGLRSPNCALAAPGGVGAYELGCDPERTVRARATAEQAAFRCVVPEHALDLVQPAPSGLPSRP